MTPEFQAYFRSRISDLMERYPYFIPIPEREADTSNALLKHTGKSIWAQYDTKNYRSRITEFDRYFKPRSLKWKKCCFFDFDDDKWIVKKNQKNNSNCIFRWYNEEDTFKLFDFETDENLARIFCKGTKLYNKKIKNFYCFDGNALKKFEVRGEDFSYLNQTKNEDGEYTVEILYYLDDGRNMALDDLLNSFIKAENVGSDLGQFSFIFNAHSRKPLQTCEETLPNYFDSVNEGEEKSLKQIATTLNRNNEAFYTAVLSDLQKLVENAKTYYGAKTHRNFIFERVKHMETYIKKTIIPDLTKNRRGGGKRMHDNNGGSSDKPNAKKQCCDTH